MSTPAFKTLSDVRRTQKVYDIFTFFNELDLLEIRLNILDPFVDYFVIVESTQTFSGLAKKLYYQENKERYKNFAHKIIHYVVSDTPKNRDDLQRRLRNPDLSQLDRQIINDTLTSDNVLPGVVHWLKEFYQKETIKKALVGLSDNDICFISDVDEIWNPLAIVDYSRDDVFKFRQIVYVYHLNNRSNEQWAGTLMTKYKNIKNACLNHLRTSSKTPYTYVDNGGWHFTNQGDPDFIRMKIEATYGREDLNTKKIKSQLKKRIGQNEDYIGRDFSYTVDETGLPQYLLEHRDQYLNYFI